MKKILAIFLVCLLATVFFGTIHADEPRHTITSNPTEAGYCISNVQINSGLELKKVTAGSTVYVNFSIQVWNSPSGSGAIHCVVVGLENAAINCKYSGFPPLFPGTTVSRNLIFTAPSSTGLYYIKSTEDFDTSSNAIAHYSASQNKVRVGAIVVGDYAGYYIKDVSVDGSSNFNSVTPGKSCWLTFSLIVWNSVSGSSALHQVVVGREDIVLECVYNSVPATWPGASVMKSVAFTAPSIGKYLFKSTQAFETSDSAAKAQYPPKANSQDSTGIGLLFVEPLPPPTPEISVIGIIAVIVVSSFVVIFIRRLTI